MLTYWNEKYGRAYNRQIDGRTDREVDTRTSNVKQYYPSTDMERSCMQVVCFAIPQKDATCTNMTENWSDNILQLSSKESYYYFALFQHFQGRHGEMASTSAQC